MSEELNIPAVDSVDDMFAGMKKKKKSKKVNFDEEVEASPAPVAVAATPSSSTVSVPSVEKASVAEPIVAASEGGEEALDFSDLKKKKKKKSVKLVLSDDEDEGNKEVKMVRKVDSMGNETYVPAEADEAVEGGDDVNEFADMKKKKKKGSKKAAFDDFEKELLEEAEAGTGEGSSAAATPLGSDGEEDVADEEAVEDGLFGNDAEESTLSKAELAAQAKAWLADDRDYTYTEVCFYSLPDSIFLLRPHPTLY